MMKLYLYISLCLACPLGDWFISSPGWFLGLTGLLLGLTGFTSRFDLPTSRGGARGLRTSHTCTVSEL